MARSSSSDLVFFSRRRRHTTCGRDWSSDVCSSDLSRSPAEVRRRLISMSQASRALDGLEAENGALDSTSDVRIGGSPLPSRGALRHAPVTSVQGPKYRVLRREKATHERPPILPFARMVKRRVPVGPWISISVVLPSAVPVLSKVILPRTSVVLILTSG